MPINFSSILSSIKTLASAFSNAVPKKETIQPIEPEKVKVPRKWRCTRYLVADQKEHNQNNIIPLYDPDGNVLLKVDPGLFSYMSLQGTGKMINGDLYNVSGQFINVKASEYEAVKNYHDNYMSKRPYGYSGIFVKNGQVDRAITWKKIPKDRIGNGYGIQNGIALEPFKTLAADIGRTPKSEPKYKGKGGLVPIGTKVFIKWFEGKKLPNGTLHDGWFTVNDTGGGIFGAHFDVFVGSKQLDKQIKVPEHLEIWFEGIEEKVPENYSYGLYDK